jgi:hypothetical protein
MRPIVVTAGPLASASANNNALSQTPSAGPLTLNGSLVVAGVAILDNPRRILITTTDSTHTFTVVGATPTGSLLTEVLTGNGTNVQSTLDYKTVTSITINGTASAAVTVGTTGVAATPWVRLDEWANTQVAIQIDVSGTVNYTVQSSLDDPNSATNPVLPSAMNWVTTNDTNVVAATGTLQTNYLFSPTYARVLLNSGSGSISATFVQANVANR